MADGTVPVLGGVTLWYPNELSEGDERLGSTVELANGALRRFDRGLRRTWTLKWNRRTQAQLDTLRAAATGGVLTYLHVDGVTYYVLADPPDDDAIAGTEPRRYNLSVKLVEAVPR